MRLFRSTALVSLLTLVSRVFGFLRDMVLARIFGASPATDAFLVAFRVPNLLRRLFAEGSFASGFVPILNEYHERRTRAELRGLLDVVAGMLLATLTLVVAVGLLAAPLLVRAFAPGYWDDPAWLAQTTLMLRITFPYALLISLTAMAAGVLNSYGRFAVPAFTPVLLNIALIAAALALAPLFAVPITALAWAVLAAGVAQLLVQLAALLRLGLMPRPRLHWRHPGLERIVRLMLPTLASSGVYQLNLLVDTFMATLIAAGAVSWLYYADRLLEFPLGVFGIAISTVILPTLSRRHVGEDGAGFVRTLDWGLRLALTIALPAALGLALLAVPIVSTLFQYGAFTADDLTMTALSLMALAFGLPAHVLNKVLIQGFFSRQDTVAPMRIAIRCLVANVCLNVLLVALLMRWTVLPPHVGLAAASSLTAWLQTALLATALRRAAAFRLPAGWGRHLASLVAGSLVLVLGLVTQLPPAEAWVAFDVGERVWRLALAVALGACAYTATVALTGGLRRETFEAPL